MISYVCVGHLEWIHACGAGSQTTTRMFVLLRETGMLHVVWKLHPNEKSRLWLQKTTGGAFFLLSFKLATSLSGFHHLGTAFYQSIPRTLMQVAKFLCDFFSPYGLIKSRPNGNAPRPPPYIYIYINRNIDYLISYIHLTRPLNT